MKYLPFLLAILVAACSNSETMAPVQPQAQARADVFGTIVNRNGETICEVAVEANGTSVMTNADGIFVLKDVAVEERNVLRASKVGYFDAVRSFGATGANMTIELQDKTLVGTVDATAGGEAETTEGFKVRLPANAIAGGYTGEVRIYADFLDPSSDDDLFAIPGFEAIDANGDEGVLESFGMGTVELEDADGNPLELADGVTAELTFPLNADQLAAAPDAIPLWYLDEDTGLWREEGGATLVGDTYVGEVSHFSTWNADLFVCGLIAQVIVRCDGEPLQNVLILLRVPSRRFLAGCITSTDDNGFFDAALPCEQEVDVYLVVRGASAHCNWLLGTIVIPEATVGDDGRALFELDADCPPFAEVTGSAVDCDGLPVTNGYAYGRIGDFRSPIAFTDAQGAFTLRVFDCSGVAPDMQIVGWDLDTFVTVTGPTIPIDNQATGLAEPLRLCGEAASINGRLFVSGTSWVRSLGGGQFERVPGEFRALDAATGDTIWSMATSGSFGSSLVQDNRVYVGESGVNNRLLRCLNAADGSIIWTGHGDLNPGFIEGSALYAATTFAVTGATRTFIQRLNATTGRRDWAFNTGAFNGTRPPTVVGDVVYGGGADMLFAVDKETGLRKWSFTAHAGGGGSPCVVDGRVFCIFGSRLVALDAETGNVLWESADETACWGSATENNGIVYVQCGTKLSALRAETGEVVWEFTKDTGAILNNGGSPFYSEGRIYAAFDWKPVNTDPRTGEVICFDAASGDVLWTSRPMVVVGDLLAVDGVLFAASATGTGQVDPATNAFVTDRRLNALDANTGNVIWSRETVDTIGAITIVDDAGVTHYATDSGMKN